MKLKTGWMLSVGLVFTAATASAQVLEPYRIGGSPYARASDIQGPMAAMPSEPPRYGYPLLPAPEVVSIVRDSGFAPLGLPQLRGMVYTVSALDWDGDDGRLVVDARTGRIISFMLADRLGEDLNRDLTETYGPAAVPVRPSTARPGTARPGTGRLATGKVGTGVPRQPADLSNALASRIPPEAKPLAGKQVPRAQQSAAAQAKPANLPAVSAAAPASIEDRPATAAKPGAPLIRPTEPLPAVQGLD